MKLVLALLFLSGAVAAQTCLVGIEYSLDLDGIDDWVRVQDAPELNGFGDFTIVLWLQATSTGLEQIALAKAADTGSDNAAYVIALDVRFPPASPLRATLVNRSGTYLHVSSTTVFADGTWHHVAVTRSGLAVPLFVDGLADAAGTLTGPLRSVPNPLAFGTLPDPSGIPVTNHSQNDSLDEIQATPSGPPSRPLFISPFCEEMRLLERQDSIYACLARKARSGQRLHGKDAESATTEIGEAVWTRTPDLRPN